jgi:hypothetical protein
MSQSTNTLRHAGFGNLDFRGHGHDFIDSKSAHSVDPGTASTSTNQETFHAFSCNLYRVIRPSFNGKGNLGIQSNSVNCYCQASNRKCTIAGQRVRCASKETRHKTRDMCRMSFVMLSILNKHVLNVTTIVNNHTHKQGVGHQPRQFLLDKQWHHWAMA